MFTTAAVCAAACLAFGPTPFCKQDHKVGENPCNVRSTDYCCDCHCTVCGPQEYCQAASPFKSDCGVCNPEYDPQGTNLCASYWQAPPCSPAPAPTPPPTPYCKQDHQQDKNPCDPDGSDYCCDYECTYCGPRDYCVKYSPDQAESGVCQSSYTPAPGDEFCPYFYQKAGTCGPDKNPYCKQSHVPDSNPCAKDGTDYCCNYECTDCGPKDYCENFSPMEGNSGVCQPEYKPSPGSNFCPNYYKNPPCTASNNATAVAATKLKPPKNRSSPGAREQPATTGGPNKSHKKPRDIERRDVKLSGINLSSRR